MNHDQELLNIYGSPLYVYQGDRLRDTIHYITYAVPYPRTRFQFASVTNGNIALLQIFQQEGWGLHGNTPGDIYLGLKAGFAPDKIVYSGSNLNYPEMEQVLHWGITTLNLDSISQLDLCCQVYQSLTPKLPRLNLGLRLNVPELTGDSRIGVRPKEFPDALKITQSAGLQLQGIHFYRGTGTNATKAFTQVIDSLCEIGQQLPDWDYLDFGGGFGYPYQGNGVTFDWQGFGQAITQKLETIGRPIDLIIEPGRAAIAGCASLLAKVVSVKWQNGKQIVGVDTTVANLSVPSVHGGYRKIISFTDNQGEQYPTDVCGNTTYSRDYLGRNCQLPALKIGDVIAILDSGAYGYAMSSHFLHRPRPAEVLVEQGTHRLIRKREDYSVLLKNQIFA
ncbi:Pyridoxal-dependent decarboxylase, C-terminal sheet domain protein [Coleofasciculus chthonoplastes PCC 7420]|uniref:Pyridoxal-dependent decarboxylase, C-terminal sheet domain protein n=1 Tax=Coleofasciculus chthonoplastes PCC 7420 TaxID=118168 RepID=B4VYU6_9CYAN|nr:decarboxylase [Coleofasciculus chthonoplastes]EDX72852.1 Pyridoxal-dependent decarboxylase, C-terminal sheet domain protein [Coleofasciculus chthonoplastes PCC 7420]